MEELGIFARETDATFLKEAIKEMNNYKSNWSFMTTKQKREIAPLGLADLKKKINQAEKRLEQLSK